MRNLLLFLAVICVSGLAQAVILVDKELDRGNGMFEWPGAKTADNGWQNAANQVRYYTWYNGTNALCVDQGIGNSSPDTIIPGWVITNGSTYIGLDSRPGNSTAGENITSLADPYMDGNTYLFTNLSHYGYAWVDTPIPLVEGKTLYVKWWMKSLGRCSSNLRLGSEIGNASSGLTELFNTHTYLGGYLDNAERYFECEHVITAADVAAGRDYVTFRLYANTEQAYLDDVTVRIVDVIEIPEGQSRTFDVKLAAEPNNPTVAVAVSYSDPDSKIASVSPVAFTLTKASWQTPQTVTVTATDNAVRDGDKVVWMHADPDPNGYVVENLFKVVILDNETPSIVLTGADSLVVAEGAVLGAGSDTDTFTIGVSQAPLAGQNIVVDLTADATYLNVSPAQATFTSVSYAPVTITVTAASNTENNTAAIPYQSYVKNISFAVTNSRSVSPAPVTIYEDDCGALGYDVYDVTHDCKVDMSDFAELAAKWMTCNLPNLNGNCPVEQEP